MALSLARTVSDVTKTVNQIIQLCKTVKSVLDNVETNQDSHHRISSEISTLEKYASYLNTLIDNDELPEDCISALVNLEKSLDSCKEKCSAFRRQSAARQRMNAFSNKTKLEAIENDLRSARDYSDIALSYGVLGELRTVSTEIYANSRNGVYTGPGVGLLVPPVDLQVTLDEKRRHLVVVKWSDKENQQDDVVRYEVRLNGISHFFKVGELFSEPLSPWNNYLVRFGQPQVRSGVEYAVTVRAINGRRPSDWSREFIYKFKLEMPKAPQVSISLKNPEEVVVQVERLSGDEQREHPVVRCDIQYRQADANTWDIKQFPVVLERSSNFHVFRVSSLNPNTRYSFRVIVYNDVGPSPPSASKMITTKCSIPGPPRNVRISRRGTTSLRVFWDEPLLNPLSVDKYRIEYKEGDSEEWTRCGTLNRNRKSERLTNLKTHTVYVIRIKSLNFDGNGETTAVVYTTDNTAVALLYDIGKVVLLIMFMRCYTIISLVSVMVAWMTTSIYNAVGSGPRRKERNRNQGREEEEEDEEEEEEEEEDEGGGRRGGG